MSRWIHEIWDGGIGRGRRRTEVCCVVELSICELGFGMSRVGISKNSKLKEMRRVGGMGKGWRREEGEEGRSGEGEWTSFFIF